MLAAALPVHAYADAQSSLLTEAFLSNNKIFSLLLIAHDQLGLGAHR